jgi:hypothetical protein
MKTIRKRRRDVSDAHCGGRPPISLALFDHFGESSPVKFTLDAAYPVDEQLAVQMIDFMLECDGE